MSKEEWNAPETFPAELLDDLYILKRLIETVPLEELRMLDDKLDHMTIEDSSAVLLSGATSQREVQREFGPALQRLRDSITTFNRIADNMSRLNGMTGGNEKKQRIGFSTGG